MTVKAKDSLQTYKVFHGLVNYGSQAGLLAASLRELGIKALSVSYVDRFDRLIDISINPCSTLIGRGKALLQRIRWFWAYDVFHFYFGTSLLRGQWDLPFYRLFGKRIVMHYLGWDVQLYEESVRKYKITNVTHYKEARSAIRSDKRKLRRLAFESRFVDKQLVCAPYISEFVPFAEIMPLAIDLTTIPYTPANVRDDMVKILHAPTDRGNKGTDAILDAIQNLQKEGFAIKCSIVENVPHSELMMRYRECDLFIDQVRGGWYGTAAIEAMAVGRATLCFLREEYFQYIDFGAKIPIINANAETLCGVLRGILMRPFELEALGAKSRRFVEAVHDIRVVRKQLLRVYAEMMDGRTRKGKRA